MAKVKISLWVPHAFHPAITQYKSMQSFQLNRNPSALSQLHLFFFLKVYGKVKSILGTLLSEAFERNKDIVCLFGTSKTTPSCRRADQCKPSTNFPFSLVGILFTMLVFGPACGFILGSFCTKIYVDAVFIDTSKENWILFKSKCFNVSACQKH